MSASFSDQLVAVLPRLRRFARGLTGSAVEADDLVQAACERALSRTHQFQPGTRFDSWMFRIVQTVWIDLLRARGTRKVESEDVAINIGSDESVRRVEARLALREVQAVVATLPTEQRVALLLVTVEGLSYKEAAEIAGVPVGTIMSRLARARGAVAAKLETAKLETGSAFRGSTEDAETE
ncbi:MAG TPA: RNA polymerase sigma factor [Stellaceae bacterium]|nr:RNA polymerase sigma factor [Stellaceae bacterium]